MNADVLQAATMLRLRVQFMGMAYYRHSCGMSKMVGGFPMCYNPFEPIGHVCKDCAEE